MRGEELLGGLGRDIPVGRACEGSHGRAIIGAAGDGQRADTAAGEASLVREGGGVARQSGICRYSRQAGMQACTAQGR